MFKRLGQVHYTIIGGVLAVLNLVVFAWLYLALPFDEVINRTILDFQTVLTAAVVCLFLFFITQKFESGEPPHVLWLAFGLGIACWTLGEIIWAVENVLMVEVSSGLADVAWFLGYPFLSIAMLRQYQLISPRQINFLRWVTVFVWAVVLGVTGLIVWLTDSGLESFVGVFYPVGDLALGVLALLLVVTFKNGRLAYPWISLLVFVVSDGLYIWADSQGLYHYELDRDPLTFFIDFSYLLAYLAMGWGVMQQYFLLHFGASEINAE